MLIQINIKNKLKFYRNLVFKVIKKRLWHLVEYFNGQSKILIRQNQV